MGKAHRSFQVSFTLEDLSLMLGKAVKHSNAQRISEFISLQIMEKGDGADAHLLKLLLGINPTLSYVEGQKILVAKRHLHSWLMTDELMLKNNLMVHKDGIDYVIATIKEAEINQPSPYLAEYETIHSDDPSTKKTNTTRIREDGTCEIDDISDFDNVK